jgi:hypothetical protein
VLGALPLLEVLDADREELYRRRVDDGGGGDGDTTRECLELVLDEAIHEMDAGTLDVRARVGSGRSGR